MEKPEDTKPAGGQAPGAAPVNAPAAPAAPSQPGKKADPISSSVASSLKGAPSPNEDAIKAHADREAARAGEEAPKKKGPGRPSNASKAASKLVTAAETPQAKSAAFRRVGYSIADSIMLAGQTLGGPVWAPAVAKDGDGNVIHDERANMREAWADLAEAYEWNSLPPWLGATIVTASYVGPRLFHKDTVTRWEAFKMKWKLWRGQKKDEERAKEEEKPRA